MALPKNKRQPPAPVAKSDAHYWWVALLLIFIVTRLWVLMGPQAELADTGFYAQLARQGIDGQEVAYRDFEVYYPPVAWWLMTVPRLLDTKVYREPTAPPAVIQQYWEWYYGWFHIELLLADVACLGLMWGIGRKMSRTAAWVLPTTYTVLTIAQPHLIYDRLDIVLLMFFLLCTYCWLRSLESSPAADRWACASYLCLGLGISFKVVPIFWVPFLLLADLWASPNVWRPAALVLSLLVGALGPFLVHMPSAGWGVFSLFMFHAERDTHLESIWSSAMLLASALFGVPCQVVHSHGGYNLSGPWRGVLKNVSSVALLATAGLFGLWAIGRTRRYDRRLALDCAIVVLVNSTVLSTVFSPQYLNWMLPLAVLLALNIFPRSVAVWSGFAVLVVAIVGISSWLFPYHYLDELVKLQPFSVVLSVIRSACMMGLAMMLDILFLAKYGLLPWRTSSSAAARVAVTA